VLADPKPSALVDNLGDSTVSLKFMAWMDQTQHDFLKTRSESIRLVKEAFDAAGIEMPEPIYRVHLREAGAVPPGPAAGQTDKPGPPPTKEKPATTIDEQIAEEQRHSDETNLLPGAQRK
jgi:small conductance mechanosensitive channel